MKKELKIAPIQILAIIVLLMTAAFFAGCKSIEVERCAQSLATVKNADGTVSVVRDSANNPVILDGGWSVDYFQHWGWQKFDALHATAGTGVALDINNYSSGADSNLVALTHASLDGLTKLVVAVGDAYTKIAGGGAQADTTLNVAARVASYFREKGGDASKATVTTDDAAKLLKVSDGTTCVSCDAAGNCTDCKDN